MTWQDRAACAGGDPMLYFNPDRATEALKTCADCTVQQPCTQLGKGLEGVWGGKAQYPRTYRRRRAPDEHSAMTRRVCEHCDEPWLIHTLWPNLFRAIARWCPTCVPYVAQGAI